MPPDPPEPDPKERRAFFPATHWTQIAVINDSDHPGAAKALEELCRTYLPAIEAFLRWMKDLPGDPDEIANEFLADFIHHDSLKRVDRTKGKFRNYLSGALRNFLRNKWKEKAKLRMFVELNEAIEHPRVEEDAIAEFDKKFVEILVGNAVKGVVERFQGSKLEPLVPLLLPYLAAEPPQATMKELATELGVTADLIYQNFKRVRTELYRQLRIETKKHLGPEDDVEEEMQALLKVYSQG